jgi:hypothetical protein
MAFSQFDYMKCRLMRIKTQFSNCLRVPGLPIFARPDRGGRVFLRQCPPKSEALLALQTRHRVRMHEPGGGPTAMRVAITNYYLILDYNLIFFQIKNPPTMQILKEIMMIGSRVSWSIINLRAENKSACFNIITIIG